MLIYDQLATTDMTQWVTGDEFLIVRAFAPPMVAFAMDLAFTKEFVS
jgi:hypothetical protein